MDSNHRRRKSTDLQSVAFDRSATPPLKSFLRGKKNKSFNLTRGIKTYFCSNVCAAYKKSIYEEIGGFVKKANFNEDMIYAGWMVKKGYGVAYVSEASVYHSHN